MAVRKVEGGGGGGVRMGEGSVSRLAPPKLNKVADGVIGSAGALRPPLMKFADTNRKRRVIYSQWRNAMPNCA